MDHFVGRFYYQRGIELCCKCLLGYLIRVCFHSFTIISIAAEFSNCTNFMKQYFYFSIISISLSLSPSVYILLFLSISFYIWFSEIEVKIFSLFTFVAQGFTLSFPITYICSKRLIKSCLFPSF